MKFTKIEITLTILCVFLFIIAKLLIPVSCEYATYQVPQSDHNFGCRLKILKLNIRLPWCERIKAEYGIPSPGTWTENCRMKI